MCADNESAFRFNSSTDGPFCYTCDLDWFGFYVWSDIGIRWFPNYENSITKWPENSPLMALKSTH